jgi:murein DD-endopeptidase MepM/ murein hydrolase activator NlpD
LARKNNKKWTVGVYRNPGKSFIQSNIEFHKSSAGINRDGKAFKGVFHETVDFRKKHFETNTAPLKGWEPTTFGGNMAKGGVSFVYHVAKGAENTALTTETAAGFAGKKGLKYVRDKLENTAEQGSDTSKSAAKVVKVASAVYSLHKTGAEAHRVRDYLEPKRVLNVYFDKVKIPGRDEYRTKPRFQIDQTARRKFQPFIQDKKLHLLNEVDSDGLKKSKNAFEKAKYGYSGFGRTEATFKSRQAAGSNYRDKLKELKFDRKDKLAGLTRIGGVNSFGRERVKEQFKSDKKDLKSARSRVQKSQYTYYRNQLNLKGIVKGEIKPQKAKITEFKEKAKYYKKERSKFSLGIRKKPHGMGVELNKRRLQKAEITVKLAKNKKKIATTDLKYKKKIYKNNKKLLKGTKGAVASEIGGKVAGKVKDKVKEASGNNDFINAAVKIGDIKRKIAPPKTARQKLYSKEKKITDLKAKAKLKDVKLHEKGRKLQNKKAGIKYNGKRYKAKKQTFKNKYAAALKQLKDPVGMIKKLLGGIAKKVAAPIVIPLLLIVLICLPLTMCGGGGGAAGGGIMGIYFASDATLTAVNEYYTKLAFDFNYNVIGISADWKGKLTILGVDTASYDTVPTLHWNNTSLKGDLTYDYDSNKLWAFLTAYYFDYNLPDDKDPAEWINDTNTQNLILSLFNAEYEFKHNYVKIPEQKTAGKRQEERDVKYAETSAQKTPGTKQEQRTIKYEYYGENHPPPVNGVYPPAIPVYKWKYADGTVVDTTLNITPTLNNDGELLRVITALPANPNVNDTAMIIVEISEVQTPCEWQYTDGTKVNLTVNIAPTTTNDGTILKVVSFTPPANPTANTTAKIKLEISEVTTIPPTADLYYTVNRKQSFDKAAESILATKAPNETDRIEQYRLATGATDPGFDVNGGHQTLISPLADKMSVLVKNGKILHKNGWDVDGWNKSACPDFTTVTHKGIDIQTAVNTPIVAVADGTIGNIIAGTSFEIYAENLAYYNDNTAKYQAYVKYANVTLNSGLADGSVVTKGQVIGYVNARTSCGNIGNNYLHIEISTNQNGTDINIDPLIIIE